MLFFCGQERCLIDANSRIRLPRRFIDDFMQHGNGEIVMHGLPEGALALYPEEVYQEMRERETSEFDRIGSSFTARRSIRRFGALSYPDKITRQGRITLPVAFREHAGLKPGDEACVVGVEIGVEIWSVERFAQEMNDIQELQMQMRKQEIIAELHTTTEGGEHDA